MISTPLTSCVSSQDWCTPLYVASGNGFNDVVKTLIAANADVNCVCKVRKLLDVCINLLKIHYCCIGITINT